MKILIINAYIVVKEEKDKTLRIGVLLSINIPDKFPDKMSINQ